MKILQYLIFLLSLLYINQSEAHALTKNQLACGAAVTTTVGSTIAAWTVYTNECKKTQKEPNLSDFTQLLKTLVCDQNSPKTIKTAYAQHPKLTTLVLTTKGIYGIAIAQLMYHFIASGKTTEPKTQIQPHPALQSKSNLDPVIQPTPHSPQLNPVQNTILQPTPPEDPAITKQREDALKIREIETKLKTKKTLTPEEKNNVDLQ